MSKMHQPTVIESQKDQEIPIELIELSLADDRIWTSPKMRKAAIEAQTVQEVPLEVLEQFFGEDKMEEMRQREIEHQKTRGLSWEVFEQLVDDLHETQGLSWEVVGQLFDDFQMGGHEFPIEKLKRWAERGPADVSKMAEERLDDRSK